MKRSRNPDITSVGKGEALQYIQIAYARAKLLLNRKPLLDFNHGGLRLVAWRTQDLIVWLGMEHGSSCPAHAGGVLLKQPEGWRESVAGVMPDFQGKGIYPALLKALSRTLPKTQEISTAEFFSGGARKSWAKLGARIVGNRLVLRRNPDQPWTKIGEWWIDDSGTALYADGDVGDMGHEAYVIDLLTRHLLNAMDIDTDDEHVGNLSDRENRKLIQAHMKEEEFAGTIEEFIEEAAKSIWKDPKQREYAIDIADGRGDARKYGMQYDGWIRVAGHGFECWNITKEVLKRMGDGIYDAGVEDIDPEEIFEIYDHNTQTHYQEVPWSVIDEQDMSALRGYAELKRNPPKGFSLNPIEGAKQLAAKYGHQAMGWARTFASSCKANAEKRYWAAVYHTLSNQNNPRRRRHHVH